MIFDPCPNPSHPSPCILTNLSLRRVNQRQLTAEVANDVKREGVANGAVEIAGVGTRDAWHGYLGAWCFGVASRLSGS
jgi:hypothetical protein